MSQRRPAVGTTLRSDLEAAIPPALPATSVPGLAIAVIRDGALAYAGEFGVRRATARGARLPIDACTVFEAASLSKPVFAYTVLRLCAAGVLDLDAPLADYLPEPYLPDEPRLPLITARRVLSHTCGLPNWRPQGGRLRLRATPGERFGYSGEGYIYLQRVVEGVLGQPLDDVLATHVFAPLGMTQSSYVWQPRYVADSATGHDRAGKPARKWRPTQANAAASLHTTARDYAAFACALLARQRQRTAVAARMPDLFDEQVRVTEHIGWGLGWGIEHAPEGTAFWHWGDNGNFKAFVVGYAATRQAVVMLTNGAAGLDLCPDIVQRTLGGDHPAFAWLADFARYRL